MPLSEKINLDIDIHLDYVQMGASLGWRVFMYEEIKERLKKIPADFAEFHL